MGRWAVVLVVRGCVLLQKAIPTFSVSGFSSVSFLFLYLLLCKVKEKLPTKFVFQVSDCV